MSIQLLLERILRLELVPLIAPYLITNLLTGLSTSLLTYLLVIVGARTCWPRSGNGKGIDNFPTSQACVYKQRAEKDPCY